MCNTPNNEEVSARPAAPDRASEPAPHFGFLPFGSRGAVISDELVNRLREEVGV
jgi:hypothetical protein